MLTTFVDDHHLGSNPTKAMIECMVRHVGAIAGNNLYEVGKTSGPLKEAEFAKDQTPSVVRAKSEKTKASWLRRTQEEQFPEDEE